MPLDTLERPAPPEEDSKPKLSGEANNTPGRNWYKPALNSVYGPDNLGAKAKIANAETNPSSMGLSSLGASGLNGQERLLSNGVKSIADKVGTGAIGTTPLTKAAKLMTMVNRKNAGIGGLVGAMLSLIVFMMFLGSTTYLINIKENFMGKRNVFSNTIGYRMQKRRINSTLKILQSQAKKIETKKFVAKATAAGFETKVENNVVKKISKDGFEVFIDGTEKSIKSQLDDIYIREGGDLFINSFDDISSEIASRTVGKTTRSKVLKGLGINNLTDWITPRAKAANPEALDGGSRQLADAYVNSDSTIKLELSESANNAANKVTSEATEAGSTTTETLALSDDLQDEANDFTAKRAAANGQEVLIDGVDRSFVSGVSESGDKLASSLAAAATENAAPDLLESSLKSLGPEAAGRITKGLANAGDVTTVVRQGCRVKGLLMFLRSVRNVKIAAELSKWAVQYLMIADSQKASLTSGTAIKVMSLYMADATKSGGMQWHLTGGKAKVGAAGLTKYGTGYNETGVLASISDYVNKVPGISSASNCKVVNNPLTQIGGTIVGGVAAVATGGTSLGVNAGWSVGLTIANEIAFAVAKPILISAISGDLLSMHETSPDNGNAFSSGMGSLLLNQSPSANGALPVSTKTFARYEAEATYAYQQTVKEQSVFDRYLSINNPSSLVSLASMQSPQNIQQLAATGRSGMSTAGSSVGGLVSTLIGPFSSKAFAAEDMFAECTDPWVMELGVATDPFCNPIMAEVPVLDLDQTQKALIDADFIDGSGQPVGEFKEFVENCFSGRTGVLHPAVIKEDGSTDPNDDTCIIGRGKDELLAGDVSENFVTSYIKDDRNFIARAFSPKAFAAEPNIERVPTKKERFAAWYGYLVDQENLTSQINNQYEETSPDDAAETNSSVVVIGDSLTVGMQNLAGTDAEKTYLERELKSNGWKPTINAQGCRAVYQTTGVIVGDGTNCPKETIVDGISTVKDPRNTQAFKEAGTFVIALGTNGGETDSAGSINNALFKQKSIELIDSIKQLNPSANIYWLNLHFRQENSKENDRNAAINQIVSEKGVRLMDWDTYVNTVGSNTDYTDDVTFAKYSNGTYDTVHHDANGYKIKAAFLTNSLGRPPSNINDTTIIQGVATDNIPCGAGRDAGPADGFEKGKLTRIKKCDVQGIFVNSQIASNIDKLLTEAKAAGLAIGGSGFRTMTSQQSAWHQRCGNGYSESARWSKPPCQGAQLARPGYSNHQMGFAIDFTCDGPNVIGTTTSPCFKWLEQNAVRFGLYEWGNDEQLAVSPSRGKGGYEPWHWSVNGN